MKLQYQHQQQTKHFGNVSSYEHVRKSRLSLSLFLFLAVSSWTFFDIMFQENQRKRASPLDRINPQKCVQ